VQILAIVDRHGLPLAVGTYAANHHEVTLVQFSFAFSVLEAKPASLIGDRAYDSDRIDEELKKDGVNLPGDQHPRSVECLRLRPQILFQPVANHLTTMLGLRYATCSQGTPPSRYFQIFHGAFPDAHSSSK
jgi:hypothetical protein